MRHEPIAIVGRACVLPGALSPDQLWTHLAAGDDLTSSAPAGRWGLDPAVALTADPARSADRAWSDRGGYVTGFEGVFDPSGFALPEEHVRRVDPLAQWVLHTGREALRDARYRGELSRVGAVLGNLSFPSTGMAAYAASVWADETEAGLAARLGLSRAEPMDRFMSGLPAHLLARALGLGAGAFALDAACASGLYAVALACERLREGDVDLMLAGAVNRADDLFIHVGFCALQALSKSGRSRPFHADADGLLPCEGAAFVALRRLTDAERDGDRILGVIRGIGLSNDGRSGGILAPSREGQVRAMRDAWDAAGVDPREVGLVECHATGTPVGDKVELESLRDVFGATSDVPIGSVKSNFGHPITAAGMVALLKVLGAIEHGVRPPTRGADGASGVSAPFRVVGAAEPWTGRRVAGVSAFGFGGNNAHVVVEAHTGPVASVGAAPRASVAVVAVGARLGDGGLDRVAQAVSGQPVDGRATKVDVSLDGLRFPPRDLEQTLAQQLLVMEVAREAIGAVKPVARERLGVFVGMGADPEVCRYGVRWRLGQWLKADAGALAAARDAVVPVLGSAGVVGTMPNIPANRIQSHLDAAGPGFTVSSEELSGLDALRVGARWVADGRLDAAIVAAVDLSAEPVHAAALRALGRGAKLADGAAAIVLKRVDDARRDGDAILALLDDAAVPARAVSVGGPGSVAAAAGRAHAASGLLDVVGAVLALRAGAEAALAVVVDALGDRTGSVVLARGDAGAPLVAPQRPARSLSFPAHPPAVRLDALRGGAQMSSTPFVLPRPPVLPRVTDAPPPAPAAPVLAAPAPAPVVPATSVPPVAVAPTAPAPVAAYAPRAAAPHASAVAVAAIAQQTAQLAAVHAHFVAQQQAAHARFLALREQQAALLSARRGAAPASAPVYVAPVAPPVVAAPVAAPAPARPSAPPAPPEDRVGRPIVVPPTPKPAPPSAPVVAAPAAPPARKGLAPAAELPGLKLDREGLRVHSSGEISKIFGPQFARQDGYHRQVRMPEPPLLLADRVVGLDAAPGVLGKGTIWTETDITSDAWYTHQGRMPAGVMIEAGQADLMLISYMGIDFLNQSERVYRLLGCTLTYRDALPKVGDTLRYDIHVDGHAAHGAVRLFFFHYDCVDQDGRPRLEVRGGQAGFFTDEELADSDGILWSPESGEHDATARLDAADVVCTRTAFTREHIAALSAGDLFGCFGPGFEFGRTHNDTPRIQAPPMTFFHEVTALDPKGGPWGRGYLKARWDVSPDDWFFQGHFKNDPCMPGTLMFEGCLQALAFYLASMGYSLQRDGWRFEPVPDSPIPMRCRGQVLPTAKELTYEIFVEEVHAGPVPMIFADLLCTVDGHKAFHARRCGLRLNPAWPLDHLEGKLLAGHVDPDPVAVVDGFRFDFRSMLACAWGRPSEAFGPMYARFDGHRKVPRLPGPPYHFVTRTTKLDGPLGGMKVGTKVSIDYDIPEGEWYFDANGAETMPFAVLLEAALQPCGWLASAVGSALTVDMDVFFRNLDGTGTLKAELTRRAGTLRTDVTLTNISNSAGMIIESFDVKCFLGDVEVYDMKTVFGFFPPDALANQKGLAVTPELRARLTDEAPEHVDLVPQPTTYFGSTLCLPDPRLCMIDRVDYWPGGGKKGLGRGRSAKDVNTDEWFFKAHFFQDPVQPGSLGIEAMIQVLQWIMIREDMGAGMTAPRFEPIALDAAMTWKYRGQVTPKNKLIQVDLEVVEVRRDERGVVALAEASLWVDGLRIYEAKNLGMRVVDGAPPDARGPQTDDDGHLSTRAMPWVLDHAPTWTVPVLPLGSMVDRLAAAGARAGEVVTALEAVRVRKWVIVGEDGPDVRVEVDAPADDGTRGLRLLQSGDDAPTCTGKVRTASRYPTAPAALPALDAPTFENPYDTGNLFHGPAFRYLTSLKLDRTGSSAVLDLDKGTVPRGFLGQGLLDAMTHGIPHDRMWHWHADVGDDVVGYPLSYTKVELFGPLPERGTLRIESRSLGMVGPRLPATRIQVIGDAGVLIEAVLVEILMPKGPVGSAPAHLRPRFLLQHEAVPGVGITRVDGDASVLHAEDLAQSDWLPGTVRAAFGTDDPVQLAIRDHAARALAIHPSRVEAAGNVVRSAHLPLTSLTVDVAPESTGVRVTGAPSLDLTSVEAWWRDWFGVGAWPVEDLYYSLIERFVRAVVVDDPDALAAVRGRPLLFLGNHQTMLESLMLSITASALTHVPTVTIAKAEHRTTWLGTLIAHCFAYPGVRDPRVITFFKRDDKESLTEIIGELAVEMAAGKRSVMVHVEGTRALSCREPVQKLSGAFVDMALAVNAPIVPVRFVGGLPVDPLTERTDFPVGFGQQSIHLGRPILPEQLKALGYKERKAAIVDGINGLSPRADVEHAWPGDAAFADAVAAHVARFGVDEAHAVVAQTLVRSTRRASSTTTAIVEAIEAGRVPQADGDVGAWTAELVRRLIGG